jgi:hypothetical protein
VIFVHSLSHCVIFFVLHGLCNISTISHLILSIPCFFRWFCNTYIYFNNNLSSHSIIFLAEHYEWEEIIIDEASQDEYTSMVSSLMFGMGCGLLSFAALRYRRIQKLQHGGGGDSHRGLFGSLFSGGAYGRSKSKYYGGGNSTSSSGGYAFDPPPPPLSKIGHNNGNYAGGSSTGNRLGFVIDMVLSTSLGLLTSLLVFESDIFYPQPVPILSSSLSINNNDTNMDNNDDNSSGNANNAVALSNPILPPQWISPIIPLVPGRSILSDTLCGPLTTEFRKFPKEFWQGGSRNVGIENGFHNHMSLYANMGWRGTKYYQQQQQQQQQASNQKQRQHLNDNVNLEILGENPTDLNYNNIGVYERLVLDNLQGFVINCERRSRHEAKLRKLRYPKRGGLLLGSGGRNYWNEEQQQLTPVVIPDDGVFADEDLELDDIYFVHDDNDE